MARPAPLFDDDGTLTVGEVSRRIDRALRREFGTTPLWVRGELRDLKRAPTGHVHFNLAGDDHLLPVVLFSSDRERVNRQLTAAGPTIRMEDGIEVRIRVELRWYAPRSQVSLRMVAIDPTFTIGRLAEDRERLLQRLSAEGLLRAQARLRLDPVPLRVGLVTSVGSAAHADVLRTLEAAGLGFTVVECDSRVQGPGAAEALAGAVATVAGLGVAAVCLVRGGGARTDLAAFDSEVLARAIAAAGVPVLTGIGHEIDTSVADEVAWQRHLTPTACGAFLVDRVRAFCDRRDDVLRRCLRSAATATTRAGEAVARSRGRLDGSARRSLDRAAVELEHRRVRATGLDPAVLLARGWSITRTAGGALVSAPEHVADGAELVTTTAGGEVRSVVRRTEDR